MKRVSLRPADSKQSTKTRLRGGPALGTILLLLACRDSSPTAPLKTVPVGSWGGVQVALTVGENDGTLKQLCASGTITQAMLLDATGRFDVSGTYTRQRGGPIGIGDSHPARYMGSTDGRTMTMMVTQIDDNQTFGPFTLTFGHETLVGPCPLV